MKRWLVWTAAVLVAAAGARGSGVGIYGSYADAGDLEAGYGGGVKLKLDMWQYVSVQASATYLSNFEPSDADALNSDVILVPVEGALLVDVPLGGKAKLYAGGGVGYYVIPEFELDSPLADVPGSREPDVDPEDTLGWFAEAGLEVTISSGVALFASVKYMSVEVEKADIDDEEIDFADAIDLSGIGVNVGLMAAW